MLVGKTYELLVYSIKPAGLCVRVFVWEKKKRRERKKQFILHAKAKGKVYNNVERKLLFMGKNIKN